VVSAATSSLGTFSAATVGATATFTVTVHTCLDVEVLPAVILGLLMNATLVCNPYIRCRPKNHVISAQQASDAAGNLHTAGGSLFTAVLSGASASGTDLTATVVDNANGGYTVSYSTTRAGTFPLTVYATAGMCFECANRSALNFSILPVLLSL